MTIFPSEFLQRMQALLGNEYDNFLSGLNAPPIFGVRINTLKIDLDSFISVFPTQLSPVPWCGTGFTYQPNDQFQPGKSPLHSAGLYYLQDPAAMAAAEILSPQPGERILDLAAAPGGKATHIASLLQNQGLLVVNEIHPKRVWDLAENMERWGASNVIIANETPDRLAEQLPGFFDRVLVDAPCSGEALFRRNPDSRVEWSPEHVSACALRQSAIMHAAAELVRPGGYLLYATCTFNPDEDEAVIDRFLNERIDYRVVSGPRLAGVSAGEPDWVNPPSKHNLDKCIRIWPHLSPGEGHFYALLQRQNSSISIKDNHRIQMKAGTLTTSSAQLFDEFCTSTLNKYQPPGRLEIHGTYLYARSDNDQDLNRLNLVHPGLWLGIFKKNRFEPAHAFALSLACSQVTNSISFKLNDPLVSKYLRGESFPNSGEQGWVLVCIDRYPIGWGKRVHGILKSHYPRGLRWS